MSNMRDERKTLFRLVYRKNNPYANSRAEAIQLIKEGVENGDGLPQTVEELDDDGEIIRKYTPISPLPSRSKVTMKPSDRATIVQRCEEMKLRREKIAQRLRNPASVLNPGEIKHILLGLNQDLMRLTEMLPKSLVQPDEVDIW